MYNKIMSIQTQLKTIINTKINTSYLLDMPHSWKKAAGILGCKKSDIEKHLKKIRREWE